MHSRWKKREKAKETKRTGEFVNYSLSACHRSPQATAKRIEGGKGERGEGEREAPGPTVISRSDSNPVHCQHGSRKLQERSGHCHSLRCKKTLLVSK